MAERKPDEDEQSLVEPKAKKTVFDEYDKDDKQGPVGGAAAADSAAASEPPPVPSDEESNELEAEEGEDDGLEQLVQALLEYGIPEEQMDDVIEKLLETGMTGVELMDNLDSDDVANILADYDVPTEPEEGDLAADVDINGDGSADTSVPVAGDPVDAILDMFDALTPEQQEQVRELLQPNPHNPALDEFQEGLNETTNLGSNSSNPLAKLISQLKY